MQHKSKESVKQYLSRGHNIDLEIQMLNDKFVNFPHSIRERMIEDEFNRLMETKRTIDDQIEKLTDVKQQFVLRYRYVLNKKWAEISSLMQYTEGHVMKIHAKALANFAKLLEQENRNESKYQEDKHSLMASELRTRQERFHNRIESDKSDNERERYVRNFE